MSENEIGVEIIIPPKILERIKKAHEQAVQAAQDFEVVKQITQVKVDSRNELVSMLFDLKGLEQKDYNIDLNKGVLVPKSPSDS